VTVQRACDHPPVPPTVTIRAAAAADVAALREVFRRSSLSNEGDRELLSVHPELLDWSDLAVREARTRLAEADGCVAGFATLLFTETAAEVEDLFVDPDCMRLGIGRLLVEDMATLAHAAGWRYIEVDANPHALSFYTRVGFVAVGEAAVPYGTGVRMRRDT
jgi:GNAT superfamily N-acetyltransferase